MSACMLNSRPMIIPPADLSYLRERLRELADQVGDFWESTARSETEIDSPALLNEALNQLIGMLAQMQDEPADTRIDPVEISTLGEYGLHLLDELSRLAASLEQTALARDIEQLSLPFALWIARHGGEIRDLGPIVNALARLANEAAHPQAMSDLYTHCCELIEAASPACEESSASDDQHPWRLLLLNRAIVATRSHNPELMEPAFDAIVECLPGDAQRFFAEGMEQVAVTNYPEPVRDVVRRYFLAHGEPRRLH